MRVRIKRWFSLGALFASIGSLLASGCGKTKDDPAPLVATKAEAKNSPATYTINIKPQTTATPSGLIPFKDAVLFEPPENEQRPPDKTVAGLNVGALFERIAGQEGAPGLWDKIALTTPDGKPIRYTAHVKTDLGTIDIELFSEAAPNHVRNFIALAQAGYYNGLPFHRSLYKQADGETLAYLEGGCPLGTGEFGFGSIGYWIKPEVSASLTHEDGTVGAVHGEAMESAACKFYISLTKSPGMDGGNTIFGKISGGLDIAQRINKRPNVQDGDLSDRPQEPVVIREVTIQASVADAAVVAQNR